MLLWGTGESMFYIFQPLYLQQWNVTPVLIGTLLSINGIALAIMMLISGYLTDRIGPRPVLWFSWVDGMIACFVMAFAKTLPVFILGMVMYGSSSFAMPAMSRYIIQQRGRMSIERALSLIIVFYNFGAVMGPLIGGWIGAQSGIRTIYLYSSIVLTLSTITVFFIEKVSFPKINEPNTPVDSHSFPPRFYLFLILSTLTMVTLLLPQPLSPNFLQNERGLHMEQIGQLGAIGSLGNALILLLLGNIQASKGVYLSLLLVGGFCLCLWFGNGFLWYALGYFLFAGSRMGRSMLNAMVPKIVDEGRVGMAYGIVESTNGIALILAPLLAGFLYGLKPTALYLATLILIAGSLIFDLLLLPKTIQPQNESLS